MVLKFWKLARVQISFSFLVTPKANLSQHYSIGRLWSHFQIYFLLFLNIATYRNQLGIEGKMQIVNLLGCIAVVFSSLFDVFLLTNLLDAKTSHREGHRPQFQANLCKHGEFHCLHFTIGR